MRVLAVDIGNTSTAIGRWEGGRVTRVAHVDGGLRLRPAAVIRAVRAAARGGIDSVALASVVPAANAAWKTLVRRELGLPLLVISAKTPSPVRIDYPRPETIGADRLADAAGAADRYGVPVLVADFGTAFTAAVVTARRTWIGGVIAPGFPLMSDYLYERTAQLPRMTLGGACPKIGRSTEEAMRFGALVGYRGMVREIAATLSRNFRTDFRLVATGGYAGWVLRGSDLKFTIDPTLTLHGVGVLAREASK